MKPNILLKLATVVSSVLLASGGIAYYAGAFNGLIGPSARPAESRTISSSKSKVLTVVSSPNEPDDQPPAPSQQSPPKTTERRRIIFSSPKSFEPSEFITGLTPANPSPSSPEPSKPSP
jgi:hypothetical protein